MYWYGFAMKKFTPKFAIAFLLLLSLLFGGLFSPLLPTSVSAIPEPAPEVNPDPEGTNNSTTDDPNSSENSDGSTTSDDSTSNDADDGSTTSDGTTETNTCQEQAGSLSWIICPVTNTIALVVDSLYGFVSEQLEIDPITSDSDSPIYRVWQYMRDLTNIVFIIFILVVIYSQLTGVGLNNYGIKRVLPRLIVAVIIVNLSFIICSLLVDVSNIIGGSLISFFESIQNDIFAGASIDASQISWVSVTGSIITGAGLAGLGIAAAGGLGAVFWMLLLALLGAVVSVAIGLITIGLRQGLVSILIMVSPLAFVAYLLPNTEKWFDKWKNLLARMLIFYPMFSFLFGASRLVGWALILSADSLFGIVVGLALQVLPLFLAISLLKMSGTILGAVSSGLNRLMSPVRSGLTGWAASHAEQRRQNYLAKNTMPGAKLRNYLAYRQELRDLDTKNAHDVVKGRAATRAYNRAASSRGRNAEGHDTYRLRPSRYTRTAKQASVYNTRLSSASAAYQNTISEYGDHFRDQAAQKLSDASAQAYLDVMKEQFRSVNNAQADQDFLLNKYLTASTNRYKNPYEFNRLILGASGGLSKHLGESSIIGQVIAKSSEIESRRRHESSIIMNKFGVDKATARAMTFDKARISDDGFETDDNGQAIENSNYKLLPGKEHRPWPHFIGVHKKTNREITADEYNQLSPEERKDYNRVRYFDIQDDNGDPVARVYSDESGYMKELMRRDIAIADPINRRYLLSVGVANENAPVLDIEHNSTGPLRKYHSTITAAMNETKYREHAAEVNNMLLAQIDRGFVNTPGQYNIGNLESTTKAAKPGAFLQNDAYAINSWIRMINSINSTKDDERFEDLFPDADIANYRSVNGEYLHGARLIYDEQGNPHWERIKRTDPSITLEDKKNFLKHYIIPKAAIKLAGMINRDVSSNVLDNMKPDGLEALGELIKTLQTAAERNIDDAIALDDKLNPDPDFDIFKSKSPNTLKRDLMNAKAQVDQRLSSGSASASAADTSSTPSGTSSSASGSSSGSSPRTNAQSISILSDTLEKASGTLAELSAQLRRSQFFDSTNGSAHLRETIEDIFNDGGSYDIVTDNLLETVNNHPLLSPHRQTFQELVDNYRHDNLPSSTEEGIEQTTHYFEREADRLDALRTAFLNLLDQFLND